MRISPKQLEVLERASWLPFQDEMVNHSRSFSPGLCKAIGDAQVRLTVERVIARGRGFGLKLRGPLRLLTEITLMFGSDCENDPQYPWIGEILRNEQPEMTRAEQLFDRLEAFHHRVNGPENTFYNSAGNRLLEFVSQPPSAATAALSGGALVKEWEEIFPEKIAYAGREVFLTLVHRAEDRAHELGLPRGRAHGLLATLMFGFGAGCENDPLYPWIGATLRDEKIASPAERAARLEKKAVTWLKHAIEQRDQAFPV